MADRNIRIRVTQDGNAKAGLDTLTKTLGAFGVAVSARAAVDLAKQMMDLGQAEITARAAVEATTGSYASAVEAIDAAQVATGNLISKTEAAGAVNTFFRNGLAASGAEAGKMAQTGQILSQVYEANGATFEKYIRFIVSGNVALMDNFNLNKRMVDARADLIERTEGLSRAEAEQQARIQLTNEAAADYIATMPEADRVSAEFKTTMADWGAEVGKTLLPPLTAAKEAIVGIKNALNETDTARQRYIATQVAQGRSIEEINQLMMEEDGILKESYQTFGSVTEAEWANAVASNALAQSYNDVGTQAVSMTQAQRMALGVLDEKAAKTQAAAELEQDLLNKSIAANKKADAQRAESMRAGDIPRAQEAYMDAQRDFAENMIGIRQDLNDRLRDLDQQQAYQVEDHARTVASIQADIAEASTAGIADRQRQLYDQLRSLAESHAARLKDIKKSITSEEGDYEESKADKAQDFQERITDFTEDHEVRRATMVAKLADWRYKSQWEALTKQIAEEDAEYALELKRMQDRQAIEVARAQREHDEKVAQLRVRLAEENAEYKKQQNEAKQRADEDMARIRAENAERVAGLQARLAMEQVAFERQQVALQKARDDAHKQFNEAQTAEQRRLNESREQLERIIRVWERLIAQATRYAAIVPVQPSSSHGGMYGYQQGTPYVPEDQMAFLHKGEAVIPAEYNKGNGGGGGGVNVYLQFNKPVLSLSDMAEMMQLIKPAVQEALRG